MLPGNPIRGRQFLLPTASAFSAACTAFRCMPCLFGRHLRRCLLSLQC